MAPKN
jgi:hypothetical protein